MNPAAIGHTLPPDPKRKVEFEGVPEFFRDHMGNVICEDCYKALPLPRCAHCKQPLDENGDKIS